VNDAWACRLTVDLDAMADNHAALRRQANGAEIAPVVKADAYGLGVGTIAPRLWSEGARRFFVARVGEGEQLRRLLGAERPTKIYVLDGCPPGTAGRLSAADLMPVLNSRAQIDDWTANAGGSPAAVHIDTGMNRLGLRVEEAEALARDRRRLTIEMVMSHLACATDPNSPMSPIQARAFWAVRGLFPDVPASLASTAGLFLGPDYHHQVARPGVGLYGGGPFEETHPAIRSVAAVEAPILQIRLVPEGETIGYGAVWRAPRATNVAIIAAGFADGVLRALGAGGYGWLDGQARPFLGRISMDLIALDVTDCSQARPGAMVELLGENIRLDDVARRAGTVPYEILTRPANRIERLVKGRA